jgi:aspartate-semialdehyde dehydrogenase
MSLRAKEAALTTLAVACISAISILTYIHLFEKKTSSKAKKAPKIVKAASKGTFDPSKKYEVGIVGATGAVGMEMAKCLFKRGFPVSTLHLYASARSAGKSITTEFGDIVVEEYSVAKARTCAFVFLAVSGDFALANARLLCEGDGPVVIDNSSAFRYMPEIPLVVPEINPEMLVGAKLIANPNCTTAIAAVVLWPLHQKYTITRMIVSTYQASSGAGQEGMDELLTVR